MSALPSIEEKELADAHAQRGFLPDGSFSRPDGTLTHRVYGEMVSEVPWDNLLSLFQQGDGWLLTPGFLDGTEIQGTGFFPNPANCRLVIKASISYEYASLPTGTSEPQQYFNYKTGRYLIEEVIVALLRQNEVIPPEENGGPKADEAGSGFYREITYREIHAFNAEGMPSNPAGPGWLFIGPDLQF